MCIAYFHLTTQYLLLVTAILGKLSCRGSKLSLIFKNTKLYPERNYPLL